MYSFSSLDIPTILPALPDFLAAGFLVGTRPFAFALAVLTAGASFLSVALSCATWIAASILACSSALCYGVVEKSYTGFMGVIINDGLRDGMRR